MTSLSLLEWLREACARYRLEPVAVFRRGMNQTWPLAANSEAELEDLLRSRGNFLPLPKEPAALANVLEVSLVNFLLEALAAVPGAHGTRGTERGYPDIEISGKAFGGGYHAVDVKVARRKNARQTQSRITLFTGNTYFKYPQLHWPGTFRPFQDYRSHLDVIALYTLDQESDQRIKDLELLVHVSWRIASRRRSSTTREYLGAVMKIDLLRKGTGEFSSEAEFHDFWRRFPFKIGRAVEQQLNRLLAKGAKS